MKLKLYLITYKNDPELNKTLLSLQKSDIHNHNYEITIVNNYHTKHVVVDPKFTLQHKIIDNHARPTFSTGHLARNWNECLIDAFVDVNKPQTEVAVLCQDDIDFLHDSFSNLEKFHKKYSFITSGVGDALHSYTVNSLKNVGLWDERFCNIGYQEADYFLRQKLHNPNSSINDDAHHRTHNSIDTDIVARDRLSGFRRQEEYNVSSIKYHKVSATAFKKKWGTCPISGKFWDIIKDMLLPQFILYPYFECNLIDTAQMNYTNYEET
jgi:hypothetical protein